jgi:GNAT superfamily N-acetyltransferase
MNAATRTTNSESNSESNSETNSRVPGRPQIIPAVGEELATGWEVSISPTDTILRNYVATLEDRLQMLASCGTGRVERTDLAFYVDLDSAYVFDNIVVPNGFLDDDDLERVVDHAERFFPPGRAWTLQALSPAIDLAPRGLTLLGHPPLMYRPAGGAAPRLPDRLEVRPVRTSDDLAEFEATLTKGYPLPTGSAVLGENVLDHGFRGWIGRIDGEPVATAGSHTACGLTEVEWVSTLADFRGKGYGAAVTWAATAAEPDVPAVLVATDDARPVYERLGYVPLLRLAMWLRDVTES